MKKNFLDLGHGGNDSGAVGIKNTYEKNIVLEVGTKVDKYLEPCNIDNKLSRNKDVTLSLSARSSASNNYKADTFVSIHCNAFNKESAQGLEIIYMSENGKALAKCILDELVKEKLYSKLREGNTGLKYQNVHVCRETKAIACLIELGFITNSQDYNLIMNNKDKFAKCIAKGICKYNKVEFKEPTNDKPSNTNNTSTVKITADILNVRSGPGTTYKVTTKVKKGEVYTITETKNNWGKLKSCTGWICLDYTDNDNTSKTIKIGSKVQITGSKYATGQTIPSWAKNTTYTVGKLDKGKALIKEITSWIYVKDLKLIK